MGDLVPFKAPPMTAPQAAPLAGPAAVLPLPTIHTDRAWLRRQGLRIAALVGGASFAEVERILVLRHARLGTPPHAAAADIAAALDFVRAVRDAADSIGRRSIPDHGPRHGGAA